MLSIWALRTWSRSARDVDSVSLQTGVALPAWRPDAESISSSVLPVSVVGPISLPVYPPFSEADALALFGIGPKEAFDPICGKLYRPNQRFSLNFREYPGQQVEFVINGRSMREDQEPRALKPGLRVLVSGDSHTEGVCVNAESFANLAESSLRRRGQNRSRREGGSFDVNSIEVLNAGKGGFSFYNYLGILERHLDLAPDVFVVAVYGGNDFEEVLSTWHYYFNGGNRPLGSEAYPEQIDAAIKIYKAALAQAMLSVKYFDVHPDQKAIAIQAASEVMDKTQALCRERGIRLVVLYIPPRQDVEGENSQLRLESLLAALELPRSALASTNAMADALLTHLAATQVEFVDLRPAFRKAGEPLYWLADWHLNLAGHRLVAQALVRALTQER